MPGRPIRIGLAASAGLRSGDDAVLPRFLADLRPFLSGVLQAELHVLGATFDALDGAGLLDGLRAVPPAKEGGFVIMTALLVGLHPGNPGLDWVIHLQDPRDPVSLYPETQALKRQCVVHGRPFLASAAGAYEWCVLEWHRHAGTVAALQPLVERWVRPAGIGRETLALIAHDSMKPAMLAFAHEHRPLLERFGRRIATGTTGGLLNGVVPDRLADEGMRYAALVVQPECPRDPWVEAMLSGPRGSTRLTSSCWNGPRASRPAAAFASTAPKRPGAGPGTSPPFWPEAPRAALCGG